MLRLVSCSKFELFIILLAYIDNLCNYQKIKKYKRKYWGNIFIGKLQTNFTYGNIPSVFTDGIILEKK
jgi:hypothetical protein